MKFQKVNLEGYSKPSRFLKLLDGENKMRVLRDPYNYFVVGKKTARGYVRQIVGDDEEVPEFLKDVTPKLTYGFVVYSHDSGHFHILESGVMLGDMLTMLMQTVGEEEYKTKDVIISRSGKGFDTKYEVVLAKETQPLPKGLTQDSPEFRWIESYFEESNKESK